MLRNSWADRQSVPWCRIFEVLIDVVFAAPQRQTADVEEPPGSDLGLHLDAHHRTAGDDGLHRYRCILADADRDLTRHPTLGPGHPAGQPHRAVGLGDNLDDRHHQATGQLERQLQFDGAASRSVHVEPGQRDIGLDPGRQAGRDGLSLGGHHSGPLLEQARVQRGKSVVVRHRSEAIQPLDDPHQVCCPRQRAERPRPDPLGAIEHLADGRELPGFVASVGKLQGLDRVGPQRRQTFQNARQRGVLVTEAGLHQDTISARIQSYPSVSTFFANEASPDLTMRPSTRMWV